MAPGSAEVTVVIPVWDAYVSLLQEAVESIRAQDGISSPGILIVDNASTVPVPEIDGVRVVSSERRLSVGAARNLGLEPVDTPFVMFWDADDVMLPGTLAELLPMMGRSPGTVAAVAPWTAWNYTTDARLSWGWPEEWVYQLASRRTRFLLKATTLNPFPTTGATVMRTDAVRRAGGYADLNVGEDWALAMKLILSGEIQLTRKPGRLYRVHPGSLYNFALSRNTYALATRVVRSSLRTDPRTPWLVRALLPLIRLYHAYYGWLRTDVRPLDWVFARIGQVPALEGTQPARAPRTSGYYARKTLGPVKRLLLGRRPF